jgi:hypothetical protein
MGFPQKDLMPRQTAADGAVQHRYYEAALCVEYERLKGLNSVIHSLQVRHVVDKAAAARPLTFVGSDTWR